MRNVLWAVCGVIIVLVLAAVLFPFSVHDGGRPSLSTQCMRNLSKLGMATEMYMSEHDYRFPPVKTWNDALKEPLTRISRSPSDTDKLFICPSEVNDRSAPSYAVNARLDGLSERDVADPTYTVRYFESMPGRNLHGGPELFPPEPRHEMGYAVCYADGHVGFVPKSEIGKLKWEPQSAKPRSTERPPVGPGG
ncbi:MAG: hypothetical protein KBC96_05970 [Armatimonadetes bacterium]|nr:hypothetical protein [Armatimonadota bacterium]